jgi:hypothetical protein
MGVKFDEEFLDAASRSSVTFGFAVPAAGFGVADELFLGAQPGLEAGTGISWNDLPQELGCGSVVTCWRRLREWHPGADRGGGVPLGSWAGQQVGWRGAFWALAALSALAAVAIGRFAPRRKR